jgi:hypothetical protein
VHDARAAYDLRLERKREGGADVASENDHLPEADEADLHDQHQTVGTEAEQGASPQRDPEAPEADALEQAQSVSHGVDDARRAADLAASEGDALDQATAVGGDDDERRD